MNLVEQVEGKDATDIMINQEELTSFLPSSSAPRKSPLEHVSCTIDQSFQSVVDMSLLCCLIDHDRHRNVFGWNPKSAHSIDNLSDLDEGPLVYEGAKHEVARLLLLWKKF